MIENCKLWMKDSDRGLQKVRNVEEIVSLSVGGNTFDLITESSLVAPKHSHCYSTQLVAQTEGKSGQKLRYSLAWLANSEI